MKKNVALILLLLILISVRFHSARAQSSCAQKNRGDADCDGTIAMSDFEMFRKEYTGVLTTLTADFNSDSKVSIIDFEIWRGSFFSLTNTPTPTSATSITPVPTTTGTPVVSGIWVSQSEIMQKAMSGATWDGMKAKADGNIGTANMSDQDSAHPENTLAVAIVAARTGNDTYKAKAVDALMSAIGTENNPDPNCALPTLGSRGLAVGRNLIAYAVAADILNFRTGGYDPNGYGTKFQHWVDSMRHRKNCDNNGGAYVSTDISAGHDGGCSNGNSLAGASRIAAAAYLGDKSEVDKAWLTFQRYAGNSTVGPPLNANSYGQTWLFDPSLNVCINPKGATKNGQRIDGAVPNDQGRGGPFQMPPVYTQYPWEGLQGIYAQALMLDRMGYKDSLGKSPWHVSDDALLRDVDFQWYLQNKYGGAWYDSGRAAWVKHLANIIYGFKPIQYNAIGSGRNMDYTQWTHQ